MLLMKTTRIPGTPDAERPAPRFIWKAEDVEVGMIVCRAHRGDDPWQAEGWTAKWTHKLGFVVGDGKVTKDPVTHRYQSGHYCQIAMTDGMVYHRGLTKEQMAARLNEEDMIPMPRSWWTRMTSYLMNQQCPKWVKLRRQ